MNGTLILLLFIAVFLVSPLTVKADLTMTTPHVVVNAAGNGGGYAYGPSIIYTQGVYHAYYCSTGAGGNDWDNIAHESSPDLVHWSAPDTVSIPVPYEHSNCDPSVVFFNGYYYLFYGAYITNVQTVGMVARSLTPDGPFSKYTNKGQWETAAQVAACNISTDTQDCPKPIITPKRNTPDNTPGTTAYGAGQPSVVVRGGTLYMWYTDDTWTSTPGNFGVFFKTSTDGVNWTNAIRTTNVGNINSIDVKYDPITKQFVMLEMNNQFGSANLGTQTSTDGIHWSNLQFILRSGIFPAGSNNPGMSGDDQGNLLVGKPTLLAYGAPYNLNPTAPWGQWNLYGSLVDTTEILAPNLFAVSGVNTGTKTTEVHTLSGAQGFRDFLLHTGTPMPQNNGSMDYELVDWDNDGIPDLAIILRSGTASGMTEVHVLSGASHYQNYILHTAIGMGPTDSTFQFRFINWNHSGTPDLAVLATSKTGSGTVEVHILSGTSYFKTFSAHLTTAFSDNSANMDFHFVDWDHDGVPDLAVVLSGVTGSGTKEVHIVSGASKFNRFLLHTATALLSGDGPFQFQFTDWDNDGTPDLVALKQSNTGTNSTEVHILSGVGYFHNFLLQTGTALGDTNTGFKLLMP